MFAKSLNSNRYSWLVIAGLLLVASGCQEAMTAPPPAMPPPVVTVTQPVVHPVQMYLEYNGSLEAVEMVEVTARVMGFLDEVSFREGDEVQQGDLLFRIDPREYSAAVKKAQADQRKATAELRHAQLEEKRGEALLQKSAISDEDVERRIAARETAEAMVMQAEAELEAAQLQLGYTEIRSPITGQISRTQVTRGNLVGQTGNTMLTTILSMDPLYVYFDAPERDLIEYQKSLSTGETPHLLSGSLPIEIGVSTEDGYPHKGTIDFRENRVDPGTGTVRMRGRIPNPRVADSKARLLYPGLYARVRVPTGKPQMLAAIPEDALMTGQEGRYVYVLDKDNIVQKRTVTVGPIIWRSSNGDGSTQGAWTLVANERAPAEQPTPAEQGAPAATQDAPNPAPQVYSVISVSDGLAPEDRVIINGLTKARPGFAVAPEAWTLVAPQAAPTN